jgi:hypothetical protein
VSDPYRTAADRAPVPEVKDAHRILPDATLEEMLFWEKIFVSIVNANDCKDVSAARAWATRAVLSRRDVFPNLYRETQEG